LDDIDRLILPGIGNFARGMELLKSSGWAPSIEHWVLKKHLPLLGICLGMQLLMESSEEGDCNGLGLVGGRVRYFDPQKMDRKLPLPHMGWAHARAELGSRLFRAMEAKARFYFVHSLHVELEDSAVSAQSMTDYGYSFTSSFERGPIFAVQFHPEKSHMFGSALLKNFCASTC
jgi:imidazole glycerol-phosphate synthase subunit HisH